VVLGMLGNLRRATSNFKTNVICRRLHSCEGSAADRHGYPRGAGA
jgi:hypothetical protein